MDYRFFAEAHLVCYNSYLYTDLNDAAVTGTANEDKMALNVFGFLINHKDGAKDDFAIGRLIENLKIVPYNVKVSVIPLQVSQPPACPCVNKVSLLIALQNSATHFPDKIWRCTKCLKVVQL